MYFYYDVCYNVRKDRDRCAKYFARSYYFDIFIAYEFLGVADIKRIKSHKGEILEWIILN